MAVCERAEHAEVPAVVEEAERSEGRLQSRVVLQADLAGLVSGTIDA